MNPRTALNIGLAAAAVALGGALYYGTQRGSGEAGATFAIVAEPAANLVRIEIERLRHDIIVLERRGARWRMTAPIDARLEEVQLSRVLDLVRARTTVRMRAADLARFELDKPWAQIRFNQHAVDFGATNSLTQELYLRSGGYVYAVSPRLATAVPGSVAKLIAHQLFAPDEQPVAFQLKGLSMRHDGVRWQVQPHDPRLSQDDLVRWVDQWRLASSIATQPGASAGGGESVVVELRDARTVVLEIVARTPDLVLLRTDERLRYHFPAKLASTLLAAPHSSGAPTH